MQLSGSPEQDDIIIDQDESSTNQPLQAYYENKVHLEFLAELAFPSEKFKDIYIILYIYYIYYILYIYDLYYTQNL
jgi:hypothetical protein